MCPLVMGLKLPHDSRITWVLAFSVILTGVVRGVCPRIAPRSPFVVAVEARTTQRERGEVDSAAALTPALRASSRSPLKAHCPHAHKQARTHSRTHAHTEENTNECCSEYQHAYNTMN